MDGVLYDSEYYYIYGTLTQLLRFNYTGSIEKVYGIIGLSMDDTYTYLYDLLDGRVPIEELQKSNEDYFFKENPINYKKIMFPDIKNGLKELKEMGLRLAVCSANAEVIVHESLKDMGIEEYFDEVLTDVDVKKTKPDPEVYLKGLEKLGLDKSECIIYEDSTRGIAAGKAAGIFTVARKDDRFLQDQSNADKIVENIEELVSWIRKENTYARSNED